MTHTAEQVRDTGTAMTPAPEPPSRNTRTLLGWAAVVLGLLLAIGLAVAALSSEDAPSSSDRDTSVVENRPPRVPQSANAAEHGLSSQSDQGTPGSVPGSANAAEHRLGTQLGEDRSGNLAGSANAVEHRLGYNR